MPPSEGQPYACANWTATDDPFSAPLPRGYSASFDSFSIPVAAEDTFFIHGTGAFSKGRIEIAVTDSLDAADQGNVRVDVEARYNDARLPDLMRVCEVRGDAEHKRGGRHVGLGIYVRFRLVSSANVVLMARARSHRLPPRKSDRTQTKTLTLLSGSGYRLRSKTSTPSKSAGRCLA